jgi:hypothetical protein
MAVDDTLSSAERGFTEIVEEMIQWQYNIGKDQAMEYGQLGGSGLKVSALAFRWS